MDIAAQAVGILAMAASIASFQFSTQKKILIVQIITAILFAIHFGMLGAITGAGMNVAAIIRNIVFYHRDKKFFSGKIWIVIFAFVNVIVGIISWQGIISLLMIFGMVFNTISLSCTDPQKVRGVMLVASPMILLYSIFSKSIGGTVNEIFSEISMIIGVIRYRKVKKVKCDL